MRSSKPIKFLVATDIHLGHFENDEQLGNDSYEAFDQVLKIAKIQDIDFLLLGGDLFDEVNPSQKCLYKCLNSLRQNVFSNKQLDLKAKGLAPNFSNENVNIGLPIFTIHGNHDYPSNDFGKISVCDLLHASNLVNYFGKKNTFTQKEGKSIRVTPIYFQKPDQPIKLAIYGIGYIKDLRFHKMLSDNQVSFEEPKDKANTISILIIHQNRWKGKKGGVGAAYENCVIPRQFPEWIDLIIWCHEHEAIKKIQIQDNRRIYQPGSTVITSFIEAESIMKQSVLLTVGEGQKSELSTIHNLAIQSIPLEQSHRPMLIRSYSLDEIIKRYGKQGIQFDFEGYFNNQLDNLFSLPEVKKWRKKPIIRFKIDYTGYPMIRLIKVQQKYSKAIANNHKIFKYSHKTVKKKVPEISDKDVLDMIKAQKTSHNRREIDVTTEVMQLFEEEFHKNSAFSFLDMEFMRQKIQDLTNNGENKVSVSGITQSYKQQLQRRCSKYVQDSHKWNQQTTKEYEGIKDSLLEHAKKEHIKNFEAIQYRGLILNHQNRYKIKQDQFKPIFVSHSQDPSKSLKTQKQQKPKQKTNTSKGRDSMFSDRFDSNEIQLKSDSDDCCLKMENQGYNEKSTIESFRMAERMLQNKDKSKKPNQTMKKDVDFK